MTRLNNFPLFHFLILSLFFSSVMFLPCEQEVLQDEALFPEESIALHQATSSEAETVSALLAGKESCNCSLEIVEASSPVPSGGSGGFLGYEFICSYFGAGQGCPIFGAWATDCMDNAVGVNPACMVKVPSGNSPVHPSGYFPFNYNIPTFENFDIQVGQVNWFNSASCTANTSSNNDGKVVVRVRCCDSRGMDCQRCYYSDNIEVAISTFAQGAVDPLNAPTVTLGGTCGCEPN